MSNRSGGEEAEETQTLQIQDQKTNDVTQRLVYQLITNCHADSTARLVSLLFDQAQECQQETGSNAFFEELGKVFAHFVCKDKLHKQSENADMMAKFVEQFAQQSSEENSYDITNWSSDLKNAFSTYCKYAVADRDLAQKNLQKAYKAAGQNLEAANTALKQAQQAFKQKQEIVNKISFPAFFIDLQINQQKHAKQATVQSFTTPIATILTVAAGIGAFIGTQSLIAPDMAQHKTALAITAGATAAILCAGIYALCVHFATKDKAIKVSDVQSVQPELNTEDDLSETSSLYGEDDSVRDSDLEKQQAPHNSCDSVTVLPAASISSSQSSVIGN